MINAQDIWNEFRNNRFVVNFKVREMIEEMKTGPEILRCIFLAIMACHSFSYNRITIAGEIFVSSYWSVVLTPIW
jgi:hypothetical protein